MGELTDTAFYILLSLVEAKHGYLIMKSIETMTNNQFSIGPASMYTTIKKLLAAEFIELYKEEEDDKRKTYIATEKGIGLLRKEVERRKEMIRHAEQILK
ncbi:PadR family transcriptional regulator [Paenibacillus sp. FSL R10-2791]|nr:PadR family transcriptional regulator [Paenibacillus odorifer]